MGVLLDYLFKVTSIVPTSAASTGFLKKVLVVVKPKGEAAAVINTCTSAAQVALITDNLDCAQLFAAGMTSIYVLPNDDLDIDAIIADHLNDFFTILVSSDFSDADKVAYVAAVTASKKIQDITFTAKATGADGNDAAIIYIDGKTDGSAEVTDVTEGVITVEIEDGVTPASAIATAIANDVDANALVTCVVDTGDEADVQAIFTPHVHLENGADASVGTRDFGSFTGVIGFNSDDKTNAAAYAAVENQCGFYSATANKAKNMFYAFGKLLSNALDWKNQQYVSMPFDDAIETTGDAEDLFDDKVSFVLTDAQYANRLALFACGGKAIVAPYIVKNFQIDLQSAALLYIAANQPAYSNKQAALLENDLRDVILDYIESQWIEAGTLEILLEESNFVASGYIDISEPNALWRIFANLTQTL